MTRTYNVPGITCDHCRAAIEGELANVEGLTRVEVNVAAKEVAVDGDASDDAIRDAITEAGYEVAGVA